MLRDEHGLQRARRLFICFQYFNNRWNKHRSSANRQQFYDQMLNSIPTRCTLAAARNPRHLDNPSAFCYDKVGRLKPGKPLYASVLEKHFFTRSDLISELFHFSCNIAAAFGVM